MGLLEGGHAGVFHAQIGQPFRTKRIGAWHEGSDQPAEEAVDLEDHVPEEEVALGRGRPPSGLRAAFGRFPFLRI